MARKAKTRKSKANANPTPTPDTVESPARRLSLKGMGLYGLGALVVGGGGAAFATDFMRKLDEHDLTRIGQGTPTIVQIHDPNCGLCRSLQRETRKALKSFAREDVTYLVANITSTEGAAFAAGVGLGHVTLVLLDGTGQQVHVVQGVTPADQLTERFARHLELTRS